MFEAFAVVNVKEHRLNNDEPSDMDIFVALNQEQISIHEVSNVTVLSAQATEK